MPRRSWRERSCVYVVTVNGFTPTSPWAWPDRFDGGGTIHAKNLSLTEARAVAFTFNKRAIQDREANPSEWNRQWAIAGCCLRNKGRDLYEDAPERPQLPEPEHSEGYKPEEIERLLAACYRVFSPGKNILNGPDQWWRGFVAISLSTGLHPSELLKIKGGGLSSPETHNWQSLCKTFRQTMCNTFLWLAREAGIDLEERKLADTILAHLEEQKRRLAAKVEELEHTAAGYTPEFLKFWEAYPSIRKTNKRAAWLAWRPAIKRALQAVILAAVKEFAASPLGKSRCCPGPAQWLNQDRWYDDRAAWRLTGEESIGGKDKGAVQHSGDERNLRYRVVLSDGNPFYVEANRIRLENGCVVLLSKAGGIIAAYSLSQLVAFTLHPHEKGGIA